MSEFFHILAVGDIHLKEENTNLLLPVFDEIIEKVINKKVTHVVLLGDTLHSHERINLQCLYHASEFILRLSEFCKVIVLIGNHDMINNKQYQSPISPFFGLRETKNIYVVSKATLIDDIILAVPYIPKGLFHNAIKPFHTQLVEKQIRLVVSHQEFKDVKMGAFKSIDGDEWLYDVQVVSGHIHEQQVLRKIYYPGSLEFGNCCYITFGPEKTNIRKTKVKAIKKIKVNCYSLEELVEECNKPKRENKHFQLHLSDISDMNSSLVIQDLKGTYPGINITCKKLKNKGKKENGLIEEKFDIDYDDEVVKRITELDINLLNYYQQITSNL